MDYARFNYVAQPEDGDVRLMPMVGVYDKWSIEWGYRFLPNMATPDAEIPTLNGWVKSKNGDWKYRYGMQRSNPFDPSAQTEDLGDDAMKASTYGIANLKRILPNVEKWSAEDGQNYDESKELYTQVMTQYSRYMRHVRTNVGGVYEEPKTYDQDGAVYTHIPKEKQRRAVMFLNEQLFATPNWMIQPELTNKFQHAGLVDQVRSLQVGTLNQLFDFNRLQRMIENEALNGASAYTTLQMFDDLRNGIFSEAKTGAKTDVYRRNLQRAYVERLQFLMEKEQQRIPLKYSDYVGITQVDVSQSDIRAMVRGELNVLKSLAQSATASDTMTRYHYQDLVARINEILDVD